MSSSSPCGPKDRPKSDRLQHTFRIILVVACRQVIESDFSRMEAEATASEAGHSFSCWGVMSCTVPIRAERERGGKCVRDESALATGSVKERVRELCGGPARCFGKTYSNARWACVCVCVCPVSFTIFYTTSGRDDGGDHAEADSADADVNGAGGDDGGHDDAVDGDASNGDSRCSPEVTWRGSRMADAGASAYSF